MSEPSTDQAETNGVATDNPIAGAEARPEASASASNDTPTDANGDTPPANGDTSSATGDTSSGAEHAATAGESVTAGDSADATAAEADGGDDSSDDGDDSEGGEGAEADAAGEAVPDGTQPKKKRRRRRKKKNPNAQAQTKDASPNAQNGKPEKRSDRPRPHRATDRSPFHTGEEVFGKVTAVLDTAIMIDLSGKALAIFDRSEMEPDDLVPVPGDRFVARVHGDGARGGLVVLTRKPLREEETKPKLEQAEKDGTLVSGLITGVIKGGVEVDLYGVRAFAPASGMDLHPANANFTGLLGQRLDFKVSQYEKGGRDVVVTRRPMLEAEAHERRKHALSLLKEDQVMMGVVRTVVDWGVFVALPEAENVEGLVHATEASHEPRANLAELFKSGDRFEVKILKIDERGKVWLSRKALIEDPWGVAKQKFAQGSRHRGKVVRLERFGAFVELEPGIDGLLHVADLSLERVEHPKELLSEGQEIDVVVHSFDFRTKKIALHPAPPPERENEPHQRIQRNALVKAEVVKGESAGVVVRLLGVTGRAARGFIPAGQTGTNRGTDLRKAFKPGSVLDVKVLDLDPRSGEPKLSIRGFKDDEERRAHREYRAKLKAEGGFGTLGDLLRDKLRKAEIPADAEEQEPRQGGDQN